MESEKQTIYPTAKFQLGYLWEALRSQAGPFLEEAETTPELSSDHSFCSVKVPPKVPGEQAVVISLIFFGKNSKKKMMSHYLLSRWKPRQPSV